MLNMTISSPTPPGTCARIVAVLVDGEPARYDPHKAPAGAFPPALVERADAVDGVSHDDDVEPLAADLRAGGDGLPIARLKVVSALTGVSMTD